MKVKKMLAICLGSVLLLFTMALPVSAASPNYAIEELYASLTSGSQLSSQTARKNIERNSMYYTAKAANADGWSTKGDEWVYFRGRSLTGANQATELAHRNYYGSSVDGYMTYFSGYGYVGERYRIAISYDSNNPYQYVRLRVGWAP